MRRELRIERASRVAAARSGGVDVLNHRLADGAAADVADLNVDPGAGIALDGGVPRFDVAAVEDLREGGGADRRRQRKHTLVEIRTHHFGNAGAQGAGRSVAGGAGVLRRDGGRIVVAQIAEGVGIDADAAAQAEHGLVVHAIRQAEAGRQLADAGVVAAAIDLVGVRIVAFAGPMIAARRRIDLVADADIDGQLAGGLPCIAGVESVGRHAHGGRIHILNVLAHALRQAEQKIAPAVVAGGGRAAVQGGQSAGEVEAAARPVGGLRLEVIDVVLAVLDAEAERVRSPWSSSGCRW